MQKLAGELLPQRTFSELIGSIYDCALDPGQWRKTLTSLRTELDFL
jgi:hypothetical protein